MNGKTMKWIIVYGDNQHGNSRIIGYTCDRCGFFTNRKYRGCPFCKRREEEACEENKQS